VSLRSGRWVRPCLSLVCAQGHPFPGIGGGAHIDVVGIPAYLACCACGIVGRGLQGSFDVVVGAAEQRAQDLNTSVVHAESTAAYLINLNRPKIHDFAKGRGITRNLDSAITPTVLTAGDNPGYIFAGKDIAKEAAKSCHRIVSIGGNLEDIGHTVCTNIDPPIGDGYADI